MTGPFGIFEVNTGRMDTIAGPSGVDWAGENLGAVRRTIVKRHNAGIHSQSAIQALLELRRQYGFRARDIHRIEAEVTDAAFDAIGGGEEGARKPVRTREEADHSLSYLLAVATIDGAVWPEQFAPDRIAAADVQSLLQRVEIRPAENLTRLVSGHDACRIRVLLADGRTLSAQKQDYEGLFTHPMGWESVRAKF
jgi:2-methylcitrate dehydratase